MSEILSPIAYQLGIGGIGGFIIGYVIKKISKLIIFLMGLLLIVIIYLGTKGIISIDYEALWHALKDTVGMLGPAFSWLVSIISILPFAGSFITCFLIGFKLG
jgi:uncharacterized membrane protein (Fun14 family)